MTLCARVASYLIFGQNVRKHTPKIDSIEFVNDDWKVIDNDESAVAHSKATSVKSRTQKKAKEKGKVSLIVAYRSLKASLRRYRN